MKVFRVELLRAILRLFCNEVLGVSQVMRESSL